VSTLQEERPPVPAVAGAESGSAWQRLRRRAGQGELGSLPVVFGLVVIWTVFYLANPRFLSAGNLTNLLLQIVAVGVIASGVVLVLLLGEIDLSVGAVSGLAAAIMAVLNVQRGITAVLAILAGLLVGLLIGLFNGFFVTRLYVPSFVVTLAGLIGWQGLLLYTLGGTGTINVTDRGITRLTGTFLPVWAGWVLAVVVVAVGFALALGARRRRAAAGLQVPSIASVAGRLAVVAVVVLVATFVLNSSRGVPLSVLILLAVVTILEFILARTRFGRYVYAVGGNAEAARRAGIPVKRIQMIVFATASTLAAFGGILAASRLLAVNQSSGAGDLLLNAIAAAVIGGTSLFGGRGKARSALLGALVIGSVSNGMDLLALSSSVKYMITAAVLLVAVTIDASARRARQSAGRA